MAFIDKVKRIPIADQARFNEHLLTLNEDQKMFVYSLTKWLSNRNDRVMIVTGGPGTGKSHVVINTLKFIKIRVAKIALTRKVAAHMNGHTIHKMLCINWWTESAPFQQCIQKIEYIPDEGDEDDYLKQCLNVSRELRNTFSLSLDYYFETFDCIVIDEVGMLPFWFLHEIIWFFKEKNPNLLFVLVGDEYQTKPIKFSYNLFDIPPSRLNGYLKSDHETITLVHNNRFDNKYDKLIKKIKKCVKKDNFEQLRQIVFKYFPIVLDISGEQLKKAQKVLCYRNNSVSKYNEFYLNECCTGKLYEIPSFDLDWNIIPGRSLFLKPNCKIITTRSMQNLYNGTELTFLEYDDLNDVLRCSNNVKIKRVQGYFPVTLGYAVTIHKYQGQTVEENICIDFNNSQDMYLIYTALSRVRSLKQLVSVKLEE